jgi:3-deoxy-D-manno-octulosonate 8-phosphate phosphatase (KDO 8-P phosphatase)
MAEDKRIDLSGVKLFAMDVDGVLTDGAVRLNSTAETDMVFSAVDGLGIVIALHEGIEIAWITGRNSLAVRKRAEVLGVRHIHTGVRNKRRCLEQLMCQLAISQEQTAYMGDDWNDLPAFEVAGIRCAPRNARAEVLQAANIVTEASGGGGAVREIIEKIFRDSGVLEAVCLRYVSSLTEHSSESASPQ